MAKKEATVRGIWDSVTFVCGSPVATDDGTQKICGAVVVFTTAGKNIVSKCPECGAVIDYYVFESAIQHLTDMIVDAAIEDDDINLTNHRFRIRDKHSKEVARFVDFTVLKDKQGKMKVSACPV